MKINLTILNSLLLLLHCSGCSRSEIWDQNFSKDTLAHQAKKESAIPIKNFSVFWLEYRKSIITKDTIALLKMVKFPLTVKGDQDEDPKININEVEFVNIFRIYLDRRIASFNGVSESNFDFIKKTEDLSRVNSYSEEGDSNRIGDMVFERHLNQWSLVQIYLDTKEWSGKINKNK